MIDNAPLRSLVHKGLTIEGYSRAAVQSYWRIPELKLGFDLGGQPWSFMATEHMVPHAHASRPHRGAARLRGPAADDEDGAAHDLRAGDVPSSPSRSCSKAVSRLDRGRLPCTLLPARPGDEIELSREHVVTRVEHHPHAAERGLSWCGTAAANSSTSTMACPATRSATCGSRAWK